MGHRQWKMDYAYWETPKVLIPLIVSCNACLFRTITLSTEDGNFSVALMLYKDENFVDKWTTVPFLTLEDIIYVKVFMVSKRQSGWVLGRCENPPCSARPSPLAQRQDHFLGSNGRRALRREFDIKHVVLKMTEMRRLRKYRYIGVSACLHMPSCSLLRHTHIYPVKSEPWGPSSGTVFYSALLEHPWGKRALLKDTTKMRGLCRGWDWNCWTSNPLRSWWKAHWLRVLSSRLARHHVFLPCLTFRSAPMPDKHLLQCGFISQAHPSLHQYVWCAIRCMSAVLARGFVTETETLVFQIPAHLTLRLERCWATPTNDPSSNVEYIFIKDRSVMSLPWWSEQCRSMPRCIYVPYHHFKIQNVLKAVIIMTAPWFTSKIR